MKGWIWWFIAGLLSLLGGLFALANPLAATLTAELLTGYLFIVVGAMMLVSIFWDTAWGSRILSLLLGLALVLLGFSLVSDPLKGILSLTILVAVVMLLAGVFRIMLAFATSDSRARVILILAGVVSLVLGAMILLNFPWSAAVVLGVLLAVELISNGISLIVVSLAAKSENE
jgi:uncharacterized membrane protein HdeD (DUF308 family)